MKARTFGLLLLVLVSVVPLSVFGYLSVDRSQETSVAEVRAGNQRLAKAVAERIGSYFDSERKLLAAIGAAASFASTDADAQAVLDAYSLDHPHLRHIAFYTSNGEMRAGRNPAADYLDLSAQAIAGSMARSSVRESKERGAGFGHTITLAVPVVVAGKPVGAVVSDVDLVGLWPPINAVRVGKRGFVRLLSGDGQLLAHGDPEERRFVFKPDRAKDDALVASAKRGEIATNQRGQKVVAAVASVPETDWIVVVEQPASEALAATTAMKRDLFIFGAVALLVAIGFGLLLGRVVVRGLERLRAHTRVLAEGRLHERIDSSSPLVEVRALSESLNDMADSLHRLQVEATARERLTTFARIAAGLAHDLRLPIEAVRGACDAVVSDPDDQRARELLERVNRRDLPRLHEYVEDLRLLAQGGSIEHELEPLEPSALAREVVENLSSYPKWRGVEFNAQGAASRVFANRNLLRRALFNLGSNAADACMETGPGGVVVLRVADSGDGEVAFHVTDSGPGIEAERIPALLNGDFASTKRSTGIGLGLGVARHVARTHQGRIEIDSEVGAGSTFTLLIPRGKRKGDDRGERETQAVSAA